MKRSLMIVVVAGLVILPALLMAQTAPASRDNAGTARQSFEKFTVEGQPIVVAVAPSSDTDLSRQISGDETRRALDVFQRALCRDVPRGIPLPIHLVGFRT